jgi:hypothetical protein
MHQSIKARDVMALPWQEHKTQQIAECIDPPRDLPMA